MNNDSISYFDQVDFDINNQDHQAIKIFESLKATSILVAILKHYGKLNVPQEIFKELITEEQIWPNDFITKNGSMAAVSFDPNTQMFGFELRYQDEGAPPNNTFGFLCTRSTTDVGEIDFNSPHYRK
jgi:hypothetical protein